MATATLEQSLSKILTAIATELSGTIGISVVEISTGMALNSLSVKPGFDLSVAAAYNAEVVKQKMKAAQALKLNGEQLSEMLITLTTQVHVIRFIGQKHIVYFAGEMATANLGLVRSVLGNYTEELKSIIK